MVEKAIAHFNPSKSQGPDMIHPKVIKATKAALVDPLTSILNKSLNEGAIPEIWKCANVMAIFKNGERSKSSNYRPISLTSVPGKLMERIIRDALVNHMTTNKLFCEEQHGFIKGKSCATQLLEYIEDLIAALDQEYEVDVINLYFCKAFDKVPYKRLLAKIDCYGIKGNVLGWIKEFLSERRQRVEVNGAHSECRDITSGIPQGSVLGPILFLIFINDLPKVIKCLIKLFADDAKLYQIIKSNQDSVDLQVNVGRSREWAIIWKMLFNTKKCKHLHIGSSNDPCDFFMPSDLGAVPIEKVEEEKDMGVIIDRKLNFRQHVAKKVSIANRNLGIIYTEHLHIYIWKCS